MKYQVMKNTMNDSHYIMWQGVAPSGVVYKPGYGLKAGKPVWIEARRMSTDEICVYLYPNVGGSPVGGGVLHKRIPAGDIQQGEWDRIYNKVMRELCRTSIY